MLLAASRRMASRVANPVVTSVIVLLAGCGGGVDGTRSAPATPEGGGEIAMLVPELDPKLDYYLGSCVFGNGLSVTRAGQPIYVHSSGLTCAPCAAIPPCAATPYFSRIDAETGAFTWDFLEVPTSTCTLAGMSQACDLESERQPAAPGIYTATICVEACDRGACPFQMATPPPRRACGSVQLRSGAGGKYRVPLQLR